MTFKILLIDDETDERNLMKLMLKEYNVTVFEAEDGHEGLEMALIHLPDLIVIDYKMPSMSGLDVIRKIRTEESLCKVSVVMFSAGELSPEKKKEISLLNPIAFVQKTFDGDGKIIRAIKSALPDFSSESEHAVIEAN